MALTAQESAVVEAYIIRFLHHDFLTTLSLYYAEGVAYSGKHPQNINNELRNALTHLARALNNDCMTDAQTNMDAAGRHIERFKRDCLKVAVIYSGKDLNGLISRAYKRFKTIDPTITVDASKIVCRRVQATLKEAVGIEQSTPIWEGLARDIARLREKTYALYPSLDPSKQNLPLWFWQGWELFKFVSGAIVIAIATSVIVMGLFPDSQATGNSIRKVIAGFIEPHAATNIPSTTAKLGDKAGRPK